MWQLAIENNEEAVMYIDNLRLASYINGLSDELQSRIVAKEPNTIQYIKNPSEEIRQLAVTKEPNVIQYIKNPSKELKQLAVTKEPNVIQYIKNPSEELQQLAVTKEPNVIQYIKNPSEELQQLAVTKQSNVIQYIKNPSEKIQKLIIDKSGRNIKYIENSTIKVQKMAISENPTNIIYIKNPFEEIQKSIIEQKPSCIKYINNLDVDILKEVIVLSCNDEVIKSILDEKPSLIAELEIQSEEVQKHIIQKSINYITKIKQPCEEVQLIVVNENPQYIRYILNPTEKVKEIAIKKDPMCKRYIKENVVEKEKKLYKNQNNIIADETKKDSGDVKQEMKQVYSELEQQKNKIDKSVLALLDIKKPTKRLLKYAIDKYAGAILYIENPSIEIQKYAIDKNISSLNYIKNPSIEIQKYAIDKNIEAILYIENPSIEIEQYTIDKNIELLKHIKNPSIEIQKYAIDKNIEAILYIENPSIEIQKYAIDKNIEALKYIDNVSEEIQQYAVNKNIESIIHINNPSENLYKNKKEIIKKASNRVKHHVMTSEEKNNFIKLLNMENDNNQQVLNYKMSVDTYINYIFETLNIIKIDIAVGYAYESGFKYINENIQKHLEGRKELNLICGSLKEINKLSNDAKILNMDLETSKYINSLIFNGAVLKTIEDRFFHGKLMIFTSEEKTVVINGSSNISHSAFRDNIELNTVIVCKNDSELLKNYTSYFNELKSISSTINYLDENLFIDSEIENQMITYEEIEDDSYEDYIFNEVDEKLYPYYEYWISKEPTEVYKNVCFQNYDPYIGMYYEKYNIFVLESKYYANAYYYFKTDNPKNILNNLWEYTKTQLKNRDDYMGRGRHNQETYQINRFKRQMDRFFILY